MYWAVRRSLQIALVERRWSQPAFKLSEVGVHVFGGHIGCSWSIRL